MKTYRKLFDILVVLALLGVEMIGLGDRVIRYVDGTQPLTNLEIEQLRQDLNRAGNVTDAVTGWLPNGGDVPTFRGARINNLDLEASLTRPQNFAVPSPNTVNNNTSTTIGFTQTRTNYTHSISAGCVQKVSGYDDRFIISPDIPDGSPLLITGLFSYTSDNTTGKRVAFIYVYNVSDDSLDGGYTFTVAPSPDIGATVVVNVVAITSKTKYYVLKLLQNSGGTLTLAQAELTFILLK